VLRLGRLGSSHVARRRADLGIYRLTRQAFLKMAKDMPELLDTLVRHPSTIIVVGVGAFLLLIGETVGTAQELPTGTIDPSDRAAIERSGLDGISDFATATQNGRATAYPGRWLIDDVARERAEFELRQVSPNARDTTHVETGVGSDDIRAGGDERRAKEVTKSIGAPMAERGELGAAPSQRTLKRSDGASPRPDTSRGVVDSAMKCIEAPVGAAPEDEQRYYRLDRETHRKCWHIRVIREKRAQRSIVENDRRQSEPTSPVLPDSAWAWWHWPLAWLHRQ
jgi:hypothetical protein